MVNMKKKIASAMENGNLVVNPTKPCFLLFLLLSYTVATASKVSLYCMASK